ncbi:unnamed protein product [Brachionus calyciflorus]|uniref:Nuclear receptor domain-containing protein n=1 Tax=Brachionus calyciflorus TaxID=104777 RepID=A0A814FKW5_9BILA|nr:unnamed protein product [Brachionus calyciflorus]
MSQVLNNLVDESNDFCQVCGDDNCNWIYGAMICEACKKFFIRSIKEEKRKYVCIANKKCSITKSTRANCQYCRYKKCLDVGLDLNKKGSHYEINDLVQNLKCVICEQKPSGIHFGVMSCEACKGFFRRSCLNNASKQYKCKFDGNGNCQLSTSRSCRFCRLKKCIEVGMSMDNCKLGRTANKVKQEIMKRKIETDEFELNEQLTSKSQNKKFKYSEYQNENTFNSSTSSTSSSSFSDSFNLFSTPQYSKSQIHSNQYPPHNYFIPYHYQNQSSLTTISNYLIRNSSNNNHRNVQNGIGSFAEENFNFTFYQKPSFIVNPYNCNYDFNSLYFKQNYQLPIANPNYS